MDRGSAFTEIETFISPTSENSAVTLIFAEPGSGNIVTPYFTGGKQRDYRFALTSAEVTDATHWTVIIRSPDDQEVYEGGPAILLRQHRLQYPISFPPSSANAL